MSFVDEGEALLAIHTELAQKMPEIQAAFDQHEFAKAQELLEKYYLKLLSHLEKRARPQSDADLKRRVWFRPRLRKRVSESMKSEDTAWETMDTLTREALARLAFFLGVVTGAQKQPDMSLQWLRTALTYNPELEEAKNLLAKLERILAK